MLLFSRLFLALSRCFLIETYGSFWRTSVYRYAMLTAASCSASGFCTRCFQVLRCMYIYIYIYVYIYAYIKLQRRLSAYMAIYCRICRAYMHIWILENIYIGLIYICFPCLLCVFFMQVACCIYTNECNLMQMYAPLHIIYCSVLIMTELT